MTGRILLSVIALSCVVSSADARPMKARTIQPLYSADGSLLEDSFRWTLEALDGCDPSLDIIVLPEFSEVPGKTDKDGFFENVRTKGPVLLDACSKTAKRCNSLVFCGAIDMSEYGPRNAIFIFNRSGEIIGKYYKEQLTRGEWANRGLDKSYTEKWNAPYMLEIEGLRYAFLTCYDFYFYENYSNIARYSPDIIIGCSHQRSDRSDVLDLIDSFLAYNTGAYLVRASVSMGENSPVGGCSCIVSPSGKILGNLVSRIGTIDVTFDPEEKYLKPAGYGNPPSKHCEYVEIGRRPWKYRPGGSAIVPERWETDGQRICSTNGFSPRLYRKNRLASYGAAVAAGATEISIEIRDSLDLPFFNRFLDKLACHALMTVRIDNPDRGLLTSVCSNVFDHDASGHVCIASASKDVLNLSAELSPGIERCLVGSSSEIGAAAALGCSAILLDCKDFTSETVQKTHEAGLRCNVFCGRRTRRAEKALALGADTAITSRYDKLQSWK